MAAVRRRPSGLPDSLGRFVNLRTVATLMPDDMGWLLKPRSFIHAGIASPF
ncbi:hypothetical protein EC915_11063 [Pseudomonas sp. LP_7_YM]|nr:hypothetical protein EC915_11063 [Pseudomonas sp. LP_7_YM]